MNGLTITVLDHQITERGSEADVIVAERNGDEYKLRVLAKPDGETEIGEPRGSEIMSYLEEKYSSELILRIRDAVIHCYNRG